MARKCCVRSCEADVQGARAKGLPLHKFPKDVALRDRWLTSGGFEGSFKPTPGQVICHRHFKRADYEAARSGRKLLLKRGSVPTIFTNYDNHPGTCVRAHTSHPPRAVRPEWTLVVKQRSCLRAHVPASLSLLPPPPSPFAPSAIHLCDLLFPSPLLLPTSLRSPLFFANPALLPSHSMRTRLVFLVSRTPCRR